MIGTVILNGSKYDTSHAKLVFGWTLESNFDLITLGWKK